jgi:hypothetical protein
MGFKKRFGKELRFWPWDLREYANVEKMTHGSSLSRCAFG